MSSIQLWNPFKELETVQKNLSDIFGSDANWETLSKKGYFYPAIDIAEDKEGFHFKMDLPDMKKEDIKIEFDKGVLTVSGTKKFDKESKDEGKRYHRIERSYGSFMRSFTLPENADSEMVVASYDKGVLDIKIAKNASIVSQRKKINVT